MVDEIVIRTAKPRNWLISGLMARGELRIGKVLKLTSSDIENGSLALRNSKSGIEYLASVKIMTKCQKMKKIGSLPLKWRKVTAEKQFLKDNKISYG